MLWTLDSLRGHSGTWHGNAQARPQREDPLSRFMARLDLMVYAAAAAFAACLIAAFVG